MKQGGTVTATLSEPSHTGSVSLLETVGHKEEVAGKLDVMREQLLALRRQQEELEQQKGDLEELRRKQDEYTRGKTEMIDSLTRALATLEREQIQAQRLAELCENTTTSFKDYLEQLQAINDEQWSSGNLRPELSRALGVIENARLEYNRARTKLDCLNPAPNADLLAQESEKSSKDLAELQRYFRIGAAATAPLILAGTIWLVLLLVFKH